MFFPQDTMVSLIPVGPVSRSIFSILSESSHDTNKTYFDPTGNLWFTMFTFKPDAITYPKTGMDVLTIMKIT